MTCTCQPNGAYGGLGELAQVETILGFFGEGGGYSEAIGDTSALTGALKNAFQQAKQVLDEILAAFGIGTGRREADMITPVQNQIAQRLGQIDALVGHDAMGTTDLHVLQTVYTELQQIRQYWLSFISDRWTFTDGRASQQAANDIMPLIDGTGLYLWPNMIGTPVTQDRWGNPTNGGRMGAVARRIQQLGGSVPGGGIVIGGTVISWPILALAGVAIYLVTQRKK